MPLESLPFADGFYISQSPNLLEKRVINLYPIIPEADALTKRALIHTPGVTQFASVGTPLSRGVIKFTDGIPYRVIGSKLYSFTSIGDSINHGSISGTDDVSMASNGINIAIVDPNGTSYFFTPSTGVLEESTSAAFLSFGQAKTVTFKGGFYVYTTTSVFFTGSDKTTNDGKTFNALDFEDADIDPDPIVKGFVDHNQFYVMGEIITEVYRNIVTAGFPLQRIVGAMIPKGCAAPNSVISFDQSFLFMGGGKDEKPAIYRVIGSSIEKISTPSVEKLIQSNSKDVIFKSRALSYSEDGNYFAAFTVGSNTVTYDANTSRLSGKHEWHERQTGITNGNGFAKWRCIHAVEAFGDIQVGDDRTGLVGVLDSEVYFEYGNEIEKIFSTKPFMADLNKMFSSKIKLLMRTGEGNSDIEDPIIRMDHSDDASKTFKSELPRSMGKVGEYKKSVSWSRLGGIPNHRTLRFKTTAAVPADFYGLFADAEVTSG